MTRAEGKFDSQLLMVRASRYAVDVVVTYLERHEVVGEFFHHFCTMPIIDSVWINFLLFGDTSRDSKGHSNSSKSIKPSNNTRNWTNR